MKGLGNLKLEKDQLDELINHKKLSLTWKQSLKLWMSNNFICIKSCILRRNPGQKDLKMIYEAGNKKLTENFDML